MKYLLAAFVAAISFAACGTEKSTGPKEPIKPILLPPAIALTAPTKVEYGAKFMASWQAQRAKDCLVPWTNSRAVSGSDSVSLTSSSWLRVSCTGDGGAAADSVFVEVNLQQRTIAVIIRYVVPEGITYTPPLVPLVLRNGTRVDTILVSETASVPAPSLYSDTISFSIEGNAKYPPIEASVPKALFMSAGTVDTISIVRIPREWTIEKGSFQGTKVNVSLIEGYEKAPDGGSFLARYSPVSQNQEFRYERFGWIKSSLPAKLVLDRDKSSVPLTATDSINIWNSVAIMETKYGLDLFYPGNSTLGATTEVKLYIGTFPRASAAGNSDPSDPLSLFGALYSAALPDRFTNPYEFEHEILHGFGHGHGCAWWSIMRSGCPPPTQPIAYAEPEKDISYFALELAVDWARKQINARYHWGENLNGERKEKGLAAQRIQYVARP